MTWSDLRELEHQLGQRWLTHESDDARWQEYARVHGLAPPRIPPTALMDSSPEVEEHVLSRSASRSPSSRRDDNNGHSRNTSRRTSPTTTPPASTTSPTSSSPTSMRASATVVVGNNHNNPFCFDNTNPFVSNNENNINEGNHSRNGSPPAIPATLPANSSSDHNHNNQFQPQPSTQPNGAFK